MKPNPYLELNAAPVYLPDTGEMALSPNKHEREMRWMAQQFWELDDKIENLTLQLNRSDSDAGDAYDDGYGEGFQDGTDDARS